MSTELHKLLTSEKAVLEGSIDVEAVLNTIDNESLRIKAENGNFPIHEAAVLPNAGSVLIIIREMIAKGADVNIRNDSNRTALHFAITAFEHHSSTDVIKLLLENGANPLLEDENGIKPIDIAQADISELLNTYAQAQAKSLSDFDVKDYVEKSINTETDHASSLMHKLESNGFVLGYVESEPDGCFMRVYSNGNCELRLRSSAQDKILGIEYINKQGEAIKLK